MAVSTLKREAVCAYTEHTLYVQEIYRLQYLKEFLIFHVGS